MTNTNLEQILKGVSRSFYLSMRILPNPMRTPISIAYLLARAADNIADSENISHHLRSAYLQDILRDLENPSSATCREFSESLWPTINDPAEKKLIQQLDNIISIFHALPTEDKSPVYDVVVTLIQGMQLDLDTFNDHKQITALKNREALEEYIYLVAGCVGKFWTHMSIMHIPAVSRWDRNNQQQLGIEFGKALQLTNILRDIAKDALLARCYLPQENLQPLCLTTSMLLNKNNDALFRPVVFFYLNIALGYYTSAEKYLLATPRYAIRLRLASIWPLLIGLKTLVLISNNENYLDPKKSIKITRRQVYSMLLGSLLLIYSNTALTHWIQKLRQRIQLRLAHDE